MKRIISLSLYGNNQPYLKCALELPERAKKYYLGWKLRYYVDEASVPADVVEKLRSRGR